METQIYNYTDYVDFIKDWVKEKGHGAKSLIASAAQIQSAYFSLVLKKEAHLSLEQSVRLKSIFEFNQSESDFFLLLVQLTKAGSPELRATFERQRESIMSQRQNLKARLKTDLSLQLADQIKYFSSWVFSAVHTAILIPQLRTQKSLEKYFNLTNSEISEVLEFLEKLGMIRKENNLFKINDFRMHLPHDSAVISMHHNNWRIQALKNIQKKKQSDLHYSSIIALSEDDANLLKAELLELIEKFDKRIKNSANEVLYSFCVDWFNTADI